MQTCRVAGRLQLSAHLAPGAPDRVVVAGEAPICCKVSRVHDGPTLSHRLPAVLTKCFKACLPQLLDTM